MTSRQPAPNGWADAYRETLEAIWQGVAEAGDIQHAPDDILALCAFAAEIREGIAAGLVLPGTDPTTIRVPLVAVPMRDEKPKDQPAPECWCGDGISHQFAPAPGPCPAQPHPRTRFP